MRHRPNPGLTKARSLPFVQSRTVELSRIADYRWREALENADVVSEGARREEPDGWVYYGSTSLLLKLQSLGGPIPDDQLSLIVRLLHADPHARLRAVRVACLEAQLRATEPLERVSCDVVIRGEPRGVRIDVDVEARIRGVKKRRSC